MEHLPPEILQRLDLLAKEAEGRDAVILRFEHCLVTRDGDALYWRNHALTLLKALSVDTSFEPVIVSDLSVALVREKCAAAGLHPYIFARETAQDGRGNSFIFEMTPSARAKIVRRISLSRAFRAIVVVGHSDDDLPMLKEGCGILLESPSEGSSAVQFALSSMKNLRALLWSLNRTILT